MNAQEQAWFEAGIWEGADRLAAELATEHDRNESAARDNLALLVQNAELVAALRFAAMTIEHRDGLKYRKDLFTDDERNKLWAALGEEPPKR